MAPHIPLDFSRELPPGAVGMSRSVAPADTAQALGVDLPADVPPRTDRPATPRTGPRKRGFGTLKITEKPVDMRKWDVSPYKVAEELGI